MQNSDTIFVTKINETYMQIGASDDGIIRELREFFTFEVPGAKFSPRVKNHIWDGKIRLFKYPSHTLYLGLYAVLKQFAQDRNYQINELSEILPTPKVSFEEYRAFVQNLNIHSGGYKINPYDYQDATMIHCLNNERAIIISPTSSGKSLSIYLLSVWNQRQDKKVLIVVPTVQLVSQLHSDFEDYASEIPWSSKENCHKIYSGQEKNVNKPIVISTWQSLQNMPASYFHQFKALIVDECLHPDTLIKMEDGEKKISEIKEGDEIYSFNVSKQMFEIDEVLKVHKNLMNSASEDMYEIETEEGEKLRVTGNHKILTLYGEKEVKDLCEGEEILDFINN